MTGARPIACPAPDELERSIVAESIGDALREHLAGCSDCRERERTIRENLAFMGRFRREVSPATEAAGTRRAIDPDTLPGYRLDREIARGGQAVVYEATQLETKRRVAVKMIEPGSRRGRQRIEREAEISASLRHPNIVTVFDSAPLSDGRYAIAMEFLEGVTLDEWARRVDASGAGGRASQREAVRIKLRAFASVCDAVHFAHQRGVIHRDLKPGNIIVSDLGVPRVLDFGIARRLTREEGITRAGEFAGTLAYASPEQVSGDPDATDIRSDVYSLGVILYETLTGRRPYDTERSLTGAIQNITRTAPRPVETIAPGAQPAGDELRTILAKALEKDAALRYQTAGELGADIDNLLAGRTVEAKRASALYMLRKTAARHRVAVTVAAGFLVVLSAFAVSMTWSARTLDHQRRLLAGSLASSNIERARLLALTSATTRAEGLIWPELLRAGGDPADPSLGFRSSVPVTQAAWALFELYSRSPCLRQFDIAPGAHCIRFTDEGDAVRVMRPGAEEQICRVDQRAAAASDAPRVRLPKGRSYMVPPCRYAVTASDGLTLVDLRSGETRGLDDPRLSDDCVATVSPTGRYLASVGTDGVLRLWETRPLRLVSELGRGLSRDCIGQFSADETVFAAGDKDAIGVWNASDGRRVRTLNIPRELRDRTLWNNALYVRLSPDGRYLAAGYSTTILLYRLDDPASPARMLTGHRGFINWLEFSADSSVLLSSGNERNVRTWDVATGRLRSSTEVDNAHTSLPAINHDGSLMATYDSAATLRIWETRTNTWLTSLRDAGHSVFCAQFSPDGGTIVATAADGSVHAWSRADPGRELWQRRPDGVARRSASFAPDGRSVAVAAESGMIDFLDPRDGSTVAPSVRGPEVCTWIGYSPDGRTLAATGNDSLVHMYDAVSHVETGRLSGHKARVVEAAFSPDSSSLVTAGADGIAIVWNVADHAERVRLVGHSAPVRAACFSPDGRHVATGGDDWTIRIWDASSGRCETTLTDVKQHVFGLAYHPSGNILFSCCRDPALQVWDVRTGRELAVLHGHESMVLSVAISPDGGTLATASADHTVGVWDLHHYQRHVRGNAPSHRRSEPQ